MIENKYASALDGLEIEDPVKSFFDFCKERENIRISRENGEDFPWSTDEIFQNGRFLNVFREDDRVSKSIIKFAGNLNEEPSKLINVVFFARWCNRQEVLDTLTPDDLNNPENLKNKLESIDPWCNELHIQLNQLHGEVNNTQELRLQLNYFTRYKVLY